VSDVDTLSTVYVPGFGHTVATDDAWTSLGREREGERTACGLASPNSLFLVKLPNDPRLGSEIRC
jgi:hypothetical protein